MSYTVGEQHAVLFVDPNQVDGSGNRGRHGASQLVLDKNLYGQLGATQVSDDGIKERQAAVFLLEVFADDVLMLHFIPLLLPPAILLVRPGEAQAITLAYPLTF